MKESKIKFFNKEKGFGFTESNVFFHISNLKYKGEIKEGDTIAFNSHKTKKGEAVKKGVVNPIVYYKADSRYGYYVKQFIKPRGAVLQGMSIGKIELKGNSLKEMRNFLEEKLPGWEHKQFSRQIETLLKARGEKDAVINKCIFFNEFIENFDFRTIEEDRRVEEIKGREYGPALANESYFNDVDGKGQDVTRKVWIWGDKFHHFHRFDIYYFNSTDRPEISKKSKELIKSTPRVKVHGRDLTIKWVDNKGSEIESIEEIEKRLRKKYIKDREGNVYKID